MVKKMDPSRLVNEASGGGYFGAGDVDDVHSYPPPACPAPSATMALACGEYGGIGYLVKGHLYQGDNFKYGTYTIAATQADLQDEYGLFTSQLKGYSDKFGLSAAVYTETTDVETEINGLLTYDRQFKCDPAQIALANHFLYPVPTYTPIIPTSEEISQRVEIHDHEARR